MKKLMFLSAIAVVLTVFNGCQKDELRSLDVVVKTALDPELAAIHFSVDEKRLVFENETEYQKLINYLAKKGNTYFPDFEKEIGFESYRLKYKNDAAKYQKIEDDLFATLINPEGVLQVGKYLFRVDFEKEKSYAYVLEDEMKGDGLKSATIMEQNTPIEFEWQDNAFAILNGEPQLKSGCSADKAGYFEFGTSCSTIQYKLVYQKTAVYFSLQSKIKQDGGLCCYIGLETEPSICWWYRNRDSSKYYGNTSQGGNEMEINYRPYGGSRGLSSYYFGVNFYVSDPNTGDVYTPYVFLSCQ